MRILTITLLLIIHHNLSAQLYSTGLIFNDNNYKKAQIRSNLNANEFIGLPSSYSLKRYCPKPGNQLQLNTSPSWATSWSAASILMAQENDWTNTQLITQNTLSPAYVYYHIRKPDDESCEAGVDLFKALEFLKNNGAKTYEDFLEFCPKGIPEDIIPINSENQISDFVKLFDQNHPKEIKINTVKKSLSENYPVVIGMYCPPSFFTAKNFWQPVEMVSTELPGHALCVVGYDDNKYGGAFEIINSWGSRWGNDGYMWIRYDDFVHFTKYAYEVFSIKKDQNDNYNLFGSISLKLNTDEEIKTEKTENGIFRTLAPLKTGTYFRIYLENTAPVFAYVFGMDASNKFFRLFPNEENISPALVYPTERYAIPGEDNYIKIIDEPGEEKLCILYSNEPLDFVNLLDNLSKYPGDVSENLDALLTGKMVDSNNITWEKDGIGFSANSKTKTAILIQIQIIHI